MTDALHCKAVRSGYGETTVLYDVDVAIGEGEIFALMGKNGAGKSTLLKTLIGLISPKAGKIELFGREVTGWPSHRIIGEGVTYAPQDNAFFSELTVDENLRMGSLGLDDRRFRAGRERMVAIFPFIGKRLRQRVGTLSGGEQAMVKVARALLPGPRLVLFDEVSEGLQPMMVDRLRQALFAEHETRGTTMLVVEQNVDFVTGFARRYGLIDRGQITGEGSFDAVDAGERIHAHLTI